MCKRQLADTNVLTTPPIIGASLIRKPNNTRHTHLWLFCSRWGL